MIYRLAAAAGDTVAPGLPKLGGPPATTPEGRTGGGSGMKVGMPREIKDKEFRVAITPAGVCSAIRDDEFAAAGANLLGAADDVWSASGLAEALH